MTLEEIQTKLKQGISDAQVEVNGDGCNCSTTIVSPHFEGMSLLARQRMILAIMRDDLQSGELHALSIKAYTPDEAK